MFGIKHSYLRRVFALADFERREQKKKRKRKTCVPFLTTTGRQKKRNVSGTTCTFWSLEGTCFSAFIEERERAG